jgi:hypothetical protein
MNEPEVIVATHAFIKARGIAGEAAIGLYTDAHASLLAIPQLRPFQRFTVEYEDSVVHPDLVGRLTDGSYFAVEAKGSTDLLQGVAQAGRYARAFHRVFLAADARACNAAVLAEARRKDIGVLVVDDAMVQSPVVKIAHVATPRQPFWVPFESIQMQFGGIEWAHHRTVHYNLPTHAMAWCIALDATGPTPLEDARRRVGGYPMPKSWRSSLDDATRLGLVGHDRYAVAPTDIGRAMRSLIPHDLDDWARVHVASKRPGSTLAVVSPQASAALRLLLFHDPMVRHLADGIKALPGRTGSILEVAQSCDRIDRRRTVPVFLLPEAAVRVADQRGRIQWHLVQARDWRTTTYMQWKSYLKHAGILANTGLGGTTSRTYRPDWDIWTLA